MINNYKKYLKYKQKYIKLKGGFNFFDSCQNGFCSEKDDESKKKKYTIRNLFYKKKNKEDSIYILKENKDDYQLAIKIMDVEEGTKNFNKLINLNLSNIGVGVKIIEFIDIKNAQELLNPNGFYINFKENTLGIVQNFYNEGNLNEYLTKNKWSLDNGVIEKINKQIVILLDKLYINYYCVDMKLDNTVVNISNNVIDIKLIDFDNKFCEQELIDFDIINIFKFLALIIYYVQSKKELFRDLLNNIKINEVYFIIIVDKINAINDKYLFNFIHYLLYELLNDDKELMNKIRLYRNELRELKKSKDINSLNSLHNRQDYVSYLQMIYNKLLISHNETINIKTEDFNTQVTDYFKQKSNNQTSNINDRRMYHL